MPSSRCAALDRILNYISVCLDFSYVESSTIESRRRVFMDVVREILTRFNMRNNYALINTIQGKKDQR